MSEKLPESRKRHPTLHYVDYSYIELEGVLHITYHFVLDPDLEFRPSVQIPINRDPATIAVLDRLVFLFGMVELISYWKLACPEKIFVACGALTEYEKEWWEHLFRNGLGEFFYVNRISPGIPFEIVCKSKRESLPEAEKSKATLPDSRDVLVLVGGGKDSIVTLECARECFGVQDARLGALCLNPVQASLDAIRVSGYENSLVLKRIIDPELFRCNAAGYLNGHTPFSAMLSFASVIAGLCNGYSVVLASNESSASEGNLFHDGFEINHQYSKSFEYEKRFREYMNYTGVPVSYLSFLRPLNEIQISGLFGQYKKYHSVFRSCNVMQTGKARGDSINTSWCGSCPKCVFTFVCLSCFLSLDELKHIFGDLILLRAENQEYVKALLGSGTHKPFECVGTPDEVYAGVVSFVRKASRESGHDVSLSASYLSEIESSESNTLSVLLDAWNDENFLVDDLSDFLKRKIRKLASAYGS